MLAELADAPIDTADWIYEVKYDGYRAMALCDSKGDVDLYSRNMLSFNTAYPSVVKELATIAHTCLLDGEVVIEDRKGVSKFQLLQNSKNSGTGILKYYVFDLLHLDGNDLKDMPLLQRKELLQILIRQSKLKNIIYSDHIVAKGSAFFEQAQKKQLEGIIGKHIESTYSSGARNGQWIKVKVTNEQETIICGITEPQGSRSNFGSLVLGVYDGGKLRYVGNCGTGFDHQALKDLYAKFKPLFIDASPFDSTVRIPKVQWLKPEIVCQVKFTEWTNEDHMRHPVFLGLRKDKKAKEVIREKPTHMKATKPKEAASPRKATSKTVKAKASKAAPEAKAPAKAKSSAVVDKKPEPKKATASDFEKKIGKATLKLTNQQKIYWPDENITKGDLIQYYTDIAPYILPYLKDRPQSLHRFPNGINDGGFFQKDMDTVTTPDWVRTEKVYSDANKAELDYMICNDKETLVYMANLGCIEINPWNSRIDHLTQPDWMVIDLDPEDIAFGEVVKTALAVRKVLESLGLVGYCKTSGATGLHIFIPLGAKYEYEVVRNFGQLIATRVNAMLPDTTSILRQPKQRQKRVYLDFLQNSKGQTLAAPYSVRPRPGATVSAPLDWSEVNAKLDPKNFTIKTIFKRLEQKGDLWKPVIGKGNDLAKALKKAGE